jgi:lipopolysaccharide/colanic/teichoic acid biosynthesis glycosyltransferase
LEEERVWRSSSITWQAIVTSPGKLIWFGPPMQPEINLDLLRNFDPNGVSSMTRDRAAFHFFKRVLDLVISLPGFLLLLPLMGVIAVLIKLDTPGPVLFVQNRVGARRRSHAGYAYWQQVLFKMVKFRTMVEGSNPSIHRAFVRALIHKDWNTMAVIQGGEFSTRKLVTDARVTRVGRFLRKSSLDELPQIWNVIRGEMSLVGPRPAIPYEVEDYEPWHLNRLEAKPGITGLWQIAGRSSVDFDEMVCLDLDYIRRSSIWLDLKILLATPYAVFSAKGAA